MIDAYEEPGAPDTRGGGRYLWWLVRRQPGRAAAGSLLGCLSLVTPALVPYLLSRAIDDGLAPGDRAVLVGWAAAVLVAGALTAWLNIMRHRIMTRLRMDAHFRTVKVVVGQTVRLGASLPRQVAAGEVVTIGVGDVQTIAMSLTVVGPGVGAVVTYAVVAGLLLPVSPLLAAVVLLGVPVTGVLVGPLMGRLQDAETVYRERQGVLTARIGDLAGGLRVLGGLGGKERVGEAFRRDSRRLLAEGYRVGEVTSWIQSLGFGLPTLFLAVVTWPAARLVAQGDITVGELVSVYGFVAVLVVPVAYFLEFAHQISRGLVSARRVVGFLRLEPLEADGTHDAPAEPAVLHDPVSGVRVPPGRLTALACARPADAGAVVDRLGRYLPSEATWGGRRLDEIALPQVRRRILVADHEADLFAGTLREVVCGRSGPDGQDDAAIAAAVRTAAADDIVRGLPDGLDSRIDAQGRNLSGGQRQRVRLVRALLADPEVLLAVEPTSALDAHTEAAVAERLRAARAGRTTLVTSTSPLVLDRADLVHHLVDGKVAAVGTHRELLAREPGYRALVTRDAPPEPDTETGPEATPRPAPDGGPGPDAADGADVRAGAEEAVR
ncbi:ABC transporter transmembrane domain-containing protein [Streptomyces cadmiisoli]|uniref:ABC transporter transmembrane domain-containing protein n=1 Tax=Streptomyces cadmiisoli TaxID=2184053 RepID=UPI003657DF91